MRDWLYLYRCGAGVSAQARYRQVSDRWRRRVFKHPTAIKVILFAPIVAVAVLDHQHRWLWVAGAALGAVATVFVCLLESPPAHIEHWRTGVEGERRSARVLAPLRRRGFALLHDLPDRPRGDGRACGNLDHVVVSPGGVYLLDSKWLGGDTSLVGATVHVHRRDDEDDSYDLPHLARGMRGRAVRLQEDIVGKTGIRFVQPVVVFWDRCEPPFLEAGNVVFLHGSYLATWLEQQAGTLSVDAVADIAEGIARLRPPEHRGNRSAARANRLRSHIHSAGIPAG